MVWQSGRFSTLDHSRHWIAKRNRWLGYVYSLEIEGHTIVEKRWLVVSSRWYHFDPGDDELDGKISLRNKSQQVASRVHHIIQHHWQSAPDDDTNALAAPINPPTVTYD
ncbi:hypothetical protein GGH92_003730 [Coemansia sp. RSA 2673]|nr:hypothetical protein GGH92_003730 [Coemansia sp. RSA 2673]